jgi:hydrogenase maturation factor HypE
VRAVAGDGDGDGLDDVTAGAVVADVGAVAAVALVNLLLPYSVVASLVNPLVLLEPNNAGW